MFILRENFDTPEANDSGANVPNLHQPLALAGLTCSSREVQPNTNRDEQDGDAHTTRLLHETMKPVTSSRDVQAEKRNTRDGQQGGTTGTMSPGKEPQAATGYAPKDGQQNTKPTRRHGGSDCSASSYKRKAHKRRYYDPLIGNHQIPVVTNLKLMEQIVDEANFLQAIRIVAREPKKACGCDRKSVKVVCSILRDHPEERETIRSKLLQGEYRPGKVLIRTIPKPNGKLRRLGIAIVQDRIVQRMILQVVMANLPESPWSPFSYAYLKGCSTANAIAEVNRIREEGYSHAIELDLKSFFDNVPHSRLTCQTHIHIADRRVVKLIISFITPLVIEKNGRLVKNRKGTPQGSVISPWLASMLYLDELDQEMTRRGLRFVRFADDVTVFAHSRKSANRIMDRLIDFMENTMECPVNREKTKVIGIEHLSLLGVKLDNEYWTIRRDKVRGACAEYLRNMCKYTQTKEEAYLQKAAQRMSGFIEAFSRIPDISCSHILALQRWCRNKWKATGEHELFQQQAWFNIRFKGWYDRKQIPLEN